MQKIGLEAVMGMTDFRAGKGEYTSGLDQMSSITDSAASAIGTALSTAASVGVAAIAAAAVVAAAAVAGLASALYDCTQAAMEAQEVEVRMDAVLQATGHTADGTRDSILATADSLSQLTRYDDEAIVSVQTLLVSLSDLSTDILPQATEATLDMATMMGIDAEQAARLLARTLESPAEGMSALTRYGVRFTEEEKKVIEAMVEAGDKAGAQAYILDKLEGKFGGVAQAAGSTFAGQLDILNNRFENMKEEIGMAILPILTDLFDALMPLVDFALPLMVDMFTKYLLPAIQWVAAELKPFVEMIARELPKAIDEAVALFDEFVAMPLASWFGDAANGMENISSTWAKVYPVLVEIYDWLNNKISGAVAFLQQKWQEFSTAVWPAIVEGASTSSLKLAELKPIIDEIVLAGQNLVNWAIANWPIVEAQIRATIDAVMPYLIAFANDVIPFVVEQFGKVVDWVVANWPLIQQTVERVMVGLSAQVQFWLGVIAEFWNQYGAQIMNAVILTWDSIKLIIGGALDVILQTITLAMQLFTGDWAAAWETVKQIIDTVMTTVALVVFNTLDSILGFFGVTTAEIKTNVETTFEDILSSIQGMIGRFQQLGKDIINGIKEGVMSMAGELATSAAQVVIDAINAAKRAVGAGSPSRLAEISVGTPIAEGVAMGILDGAMGIQSALVGATAGMLTSSSVAGSMAGMSSYDNSRNYNAPLVQFGDVSVSNGMEQAAFEWRVEQAVRRALAG